MITTKDKKMLQNKGLNLQAIQDLYDLQKEWGVDPIWMLGVAYIYGEAQGKREERARYSADK